jgi:hypothetical protein
MKTSKFWDYMSGMIVHHQPLYNWRHVLKDELDFEEFKEKFLALIDEYAENIICPEPCTFKCDREIVRQYNKDNEEIYEAVCPEWGNKYFAIKEIDVLYYKVKTHALNKAIADALGIHFELIKLRGAGESWRIGEYPLENGNGTSSVFFTLEYAPHKIMELILDCNRLTRAGYLFLGTGKHILNQKCEEMLLERGAIFVALNETLDLNHDAEFYFLKPIDIKEEASPPKPEKIIPANARRIYKKVVGDSEHWLVDGELKKIYKRTDCAQSIILNILYAQIGNGWIRHQIFMNATGWYDEVYWGVEETRIGKMQQLLRHLRRHLKVKIIFSKKDGIRFSEEVVN